MPSPTPATTLANGAPGAPLPLRRLVLASNNAGKRREFAALFGPLGIELINQGQLGIPEADEPHPSFVENALAKARHAALLSGLPAIADDSGLCVPVLDGAPGVHSARYAQRAGGAKSDAANNRQLLGALAGQADRRAYFTCVLALLRGPNDPEPLIVHGHWHGEILTEARGAHGFGYDPLFFIPALDATAAELPAELKNTHSHRAQALRRLFAVLSRNPVKNLAGSSASGAHLSPDVGSAFSPDSNGSPSS
jgi:XTP/dITP diphosphohydrolase